jgi:hypothetical protein
MSLVDVNRNRKLRAIMGCVFLYTAFHEEHCQKIKSTMLVLTTTLLIVINTSAQEIRLNAYGGYVFDDAISTTYSNNTYFTGTLKGGALYGTGLEYMVGPDYGVELLFMRQNTHAPITWYDNSTKQAEFGVTANWLMLGFDRYIISNPKVKPYGGLQLGVATFNVDNPVSNSSSSVTKFAWGMRLGADFFLSGNFGIKIQTNLMSAVQAVGGGVYFGTGGSGVTVSGYSSLLQFGFTGGLILRLKTQ